jgi:hypothetical protein
MSMTRLTAAIMVGFVGVLVGVMGAVAFVRPDNAAAIIGALTGAVASLTAGIWGALKVRC